MAVSTQAAARDVNWVLRRVDQLMEENQDDRAARWRIRQIMNGGADGIDAVLAWNMGKEASMRTQGRVSDQIGVDLPTVNLLASGLDRLGKQLGKQPTLKTPKGNPEGAQRRIDIIDTWDEWQEIDLDLPQMGRWVPGYGFGVWVMAQRRNPDNGELYPTMELRKPHACYPGWLGAKQQPVDLAVTRMVPLYALAEAYPDATDWDKAEDHLDQKYSKTRTEAIIESTSHGRIVNLDALKGAAAATRDWEGRQTGIEVVEYYCDDGTHIVIPVLELRLRWIESPIPGGTFDVPKRFAFDTLVSQYHHSIGIQAMMAKLNILGLVASEDSVFRETNIIGEMKGEVYEKGRLAFNFFEPGTQIERGQIDQVNHIWGQVDRLERQLRISANYDVQQDAISPNSFATGQGMRELQGALVENVTEYLNVMRRSLQRMDRKRLQWAEAVYGSKSRLYYDTEGKARRFNPEAAISGDYRTRRVYGAMATFDTAQKIVIGLQLLDKVIDVETFQENIDGLTDTPLINQRLTTSKYREALLGRLMARTEQDPRADAVLVQIMQEPKREMELLGQYFTAEGEEPPALPMAGGAPELPPEAISSVLSRVEQSGGVEGGVQTVATV